MATRAAAWEPRSYLSNPDEFGKVSAPAHRTPVDLADGGRLIASLAQHRAAFVIRSYRRKGMTVRELATLMDASEDYLSGLLTGRYPASLDELGKWALALDDITILPVFDGLSDLRP